MPDIAHDFPIAAPRSRVFEAISTPDGVDAWWTLRSAGTAEAGAEWELGFGPGYAWRARVSQCDPDATFEWELTHADADWTGTRVGFALEDRQGVTQVRFHHTGWPSPNAHYRTSCYSWAMYLRLLRRWVERGEVVAYADRLDA